MAEPVSSGAHRRDQNKIMPKGCENPTTIFSFFLTGSGKKRRSNVDWVGFAAATSEKGGAPSGWRRVKSLWPNTTRENFTYSVMGSVPRSRSTCSGDKIFNQLERAVAKWEEAITRFVVKRTIEGPAEIGTTRRVFRACDSSGVRGRWGRHSSVDASGSAGQGIIDLRPI